MNKGIGHRRVNRALVGCVLLISAGAARGSPGDGISLNSLRLQPYASLYGNWNSNVLLTETNALEDTSWATDYGVDFNYGEVRTTVGGRLWGLTERYDDFHDLDRDDFGDEVTVSYTTPRGMRLSVQQRLSDIQDVDYTIGKVENVTYNQVAAEVIRPLTPKFSGSASYDFRNTDFDSPNFFDWQQQLIRALADYDATAKSRTYVSGTVGIQDSEGNDEKGTYYSAMAGVRSQQSAKLSGMLGFGLVGLSSDDADINDLGFEASAVWTATPRIDVTASASKVIEPSSISRDNYHTRTSLYAGLAYRPIDSLSVSVSGTYEEIDLEDPIRVDRFRWMKKKDQILSGTLRVEYICPAKFLRFFAQAEQEELDSSLPVSDYARTLVSSGIQLKY